jgi:23S rRNA pseudouridine1911/1915/1917 synthase
VSEPPATLIVAESDRDRRLDVFLAERLQLSRSQARRLLARDAVRLDGRPVASGGKGIALSPGSSVEVAPFSRPGHERARPQGELPLVVLASGPGWLAIDKAAGTPVHPLSEDETGTVLNALIARHPEVHGVGEGGLRSGVVHRLDVETSGVLLFATREPDWQRIRAGFREHRVEKIYRALVAGRLEEERQVELPLVTARHRPARVRVAPEGETTRGARLCQLRFRPLELFDSATLVEVRPRTGFLHQIRATFAHLGFPLLGDATYGKGHEPGVPRHMLHAAALRFEDVAAESPAPEDFEALCDALRGGGA